MLNGHGDDLYKVKGELKANFSSNVFYKGCSYKLIEAISKGINKINNYPSPQAQELAILAAEHYHISEQNFLFTNGATEAFYLIAHLFTGKKAAIVAPTFAEYEDACNLYNLTVKLITPSEIKSTDADIVFICNPNNPNGNTWDVRELQNLIKTTPNTYFVIDEAYIEFTNATESMLKHIPNYEHLIIVRSLTKTFAMPGVRLGYIVANESFIEKIKTCKMPWSVNAFAIEAGKFIFNNYQDLRFNVTDLLREKEVLWKAINALEYFECVQSNTSYFLVEVKKGTAAALKAKLLETNQILVRDATNFKGLKGQFIRISVQTKEQNDMLVKALKVWME